MKILDRDSLNQYLSSFQLETIFHKQIIPRLLLYEFNEGEYICSQGDTPEYLYVLVKGRVKVFITSTEGKTLTLSFKTPIELIGDIEFVSGMNTMNTIEAVSTVRVIDVHYQWLEMYGKDDPLFLQFMLDIIAKKFHVKSHSMSFNLMYPVDVRLASYLLSISDDDFKMGAVTKQHLLVNSKDIADLIGTSHRHLNRTIQQFCKKGLVERKNEFVIVRDPEGLRNLASHNIYERD
ncbi:CRP-like cAMP-binding protein [Croceifilum oryzae]|uniref:CRP-like cAMP-binding protein n=1 Tax=Croceifilum oryzae TaxID=1553429 RepID=A0AAJ1WS62_9BACL|nr:helix-turn-helix domain-containing protein [Croceifilum oryzae]MDQ0417340.1 CRP-like cAMP-binding protein [Croceifilum oryzae]